MTTLHPGFTFMGLPDSSPEIRLAPIEGRRSQRPSLVTLAKDEESRSAAVLLGRIFYREDLLVYLPRTPDLREASDAALALAAYCHLGRKGLERLEGEFALVIWDGKRRRMWAQRDPFGCWPLFWSATDAAVGVSTSLEALAAEQPGRSFNLDALAEFLMQPLPASELPCEQTAFHRI
jgi:asparagine synthase (glutamine-hydrolysing)